MDNLAARYEILQGTLEAERVIDRLRAAILELPPVPAGDNNDCPEAMADPEYDCPEPYIPPENPIRVYNKLVAIIERIEPEINKLRGLKRVEQTFQTATSTNGR